MVDMTNLSNITSLQGVAYFANNQTDGILFIGGIITLSIVMMIVLSRNQEPFLNVMAATGWTFFIISMFFWLALLIPTILPLGYLMIAATTTLILYATK